MNYTAIYSTAKLQNIQYSFTAQDTDHAISFCKWKFHPVGDLQIRNDDTNEIVATVSYE